MSVRVNEDWRKCPVIYRRGQQPPSAVIGVIIPPSKPSLDSSTLFTLGYREVAPDLLVRTGKTKARRPLCTFEMWYLEGTSARHVCGFGATPREAHADAWRLRRQVANHGSRIAAAEYARERIKARGTEYVDDEVAPVALVG